MRWNVFDGHVSIVQYSGVLWRIETCTEEHAFIAADGTFLEKIATSNRCYHEMTKKYWLDRWVRQDIGFHQAEINPYLREYWHRLQGDSNTTVFVPLCGKSADLLWLRRRHQFVLGVELSAIATEAFFVEHHLNPQRRTEERFIHWEANGIHILCGDFFDLCAHDLAQVRAVYDRAALIALPPAMRRRYVRHLIQILPPGIPMLLITLEYPPHEMTGPPFSVTLSEVKDLYSTYAEIELLHRQEVLEQHAKFQARGLSQLQENVVLLKIFRD